LHGFCTGRECTTLSHSHPDFSGLHMVTFKKGNMMV
jgi:hypothetical protein